MPKADWQAQTIGAAANWEAGITEAARNKSFASGVNRAGTKKWQSKAISKGAARYGAGVADAQPDYQAGFEPYRQIIESTTLPPRFAKGDPRNVERVKVMAAALRKGKVSGR
jgi:predicted aminopeptidase